METQLLERLNEATELNLATQLSGLAKGLGVYVLIKQGMVVYAGKASVVGLPTRLTYHFKKLKRNRHFDVTDFSYKVLEIGEKWLVLGAEQILIDHFTPIWNGTGFGNKEPGKGRPGVRICKWDLMYPEQEDKIIEKVVDNPKQIP